MQLDLPLVQTVLIAAGMIASALTSYVSLRTRTLMLEMKLEIAADLARVRLDYSKRTDVTTLSDQVAGIAIACAACGRPQENAAIHRRMDRLEDRTADVIQQLRAKAKDA